MSLEKSTKLCKFCLLPTGHTGPHVVHRPVQLPTTGAVR